MVRHAETLQGIVNSVDRSVKRLMPGALPNPCPHLVSVELDHEVTGELEVAQLAKMELQRDLIRLGGHKLQREKLRLCVKGYEANGG